MCSCVVPIGIFSVFSSFFHFKSKLILCISSIHHIFAVERRTTDRYSIWLLFIRKLCLQLHFFLLFLPYINILLNLIHAYFNCVQTERMRRGRSGMNREKMTQSSE